jgi:hypothetical protein
MSLEILMRSLHPMIRRLQMRKLALLLLGKRQNLSRLSQLTRFLVIGSTAIAGS